MRKSEIAAQVAGRASLTKAQAKSAINAVFEVIRDALGNGDTVSVTGFGRFSTKSRPARTGAESADGRERRHRCVEGSLVQGREGASG